MKKFAVVGSGLAGLATAYALSRRGYQVVVFEQFGPFHHLGSSHGRSRIIRRAYPDSEFTRMMMEAYPMWADLEKASGRQLVHEVGLLFFGAHDSENLACVAEGLAEHRVNHSVLTGNEAKRVFPDLHLDANEIGIWTPEAGWVEADTTLHALKDLCAAKCTEFRYEAKVDPHKLDKDFDATFVCTGPWIREWLPIDVLVSMQTFAYANVDVGGPVWIEDSESFAYGFPTDELGLKLALHAWGPEVDPTAPRPAPRPEVLETLRNVVSHRFGAVDPVLSLAQTCLYTNTADEGFRFGCLGGNRFYMSACSGHAFKFGPWLGEQMIRQAGL